MTVGDGKSRFTQARRKQRDHRCREVPRLQGHAEALLTLATTQGFARWVGLGIVVRGWVLVAQGQDAAGLQCMQQGLPR